MTSERHTPAKPVICVLACLVVGITTAFLLAACQAPSTSTSPAPKTASEIDVSKAFPSWNKDSETLKQLIEFVRGATTPGESFVDPWDRVATFDMDGTLICEKAPVYFDYCLTMHRVLDDPSYQATPEERAAMQETRELANNGQAVEVEGPNKSVMVARAFKGMTPAEFRAYVDSYASTTQAAGFEGMAYAESFYKPMVEVVNFLQANDFDVWVVSACEREAARAVVDELGIPYDHVIATDVHYVASELGDKPADEFNMSSADKIVLGEPLDPVECGQSNKPAAIEREIGRRPIIAFGNSKGDYSMLNYAKGNPAHPGLGMLVVCDDTTREYGSDSKAADYRNEIAAQGWTGISMANDWSTIYGEGVRKTQLPGAAVTAEAA